MVKVVLALVLHHGGRSTVDNETATKCVCGISTAVMHGPSMMDSSTAWLQWKRLSFLLNHRMTLFVCTCNLTHIRLSNCNTIQHNTKTRRKN